MLLFYCKVIFSSLFLIVLHDLANVRDNSFSRAETQSEITMSNVQIKNTSFRKNAFKLGNHIHLWINNMRVEKSTTSNDFLEAKQNSRFEFTTLILEDVEIYDNMFKLFTISHGNVAHKVYNLEMRKTLVMWSVVKVEFNFNKTT